MSCTVKLQEGVYSTGRRPNRAEYAAQARRVQASVLCITRDGFTVLGRTVGIRNWLAMQEQSFTSVDQPGFEKVAHVVVVDTAIFGQGGASALRDNLADTGVLFLETIDEQEILEAVVKKWRSLQPAPEVEETKLMDKLKTLFFSTEKVEESVVAATTA